MSRAQLLNIEYRQDQGLVFQWKYANSYQQETYFRHIIVLLTDETDKANIFLQKFIKKIRSGDLYNVYYSNRQSDVQSLGWKQKPLAEDYKPKKHIIKEQILNTNRQRVLHQIEQTYEDFSEPVVVTFFLTSLEDRDQLEDTIIARRIHGKYDFIVAFFAPVEKSTLSFAQKISTFAILPTELDTQIHYYLNNVYQAALIYAKVVVECSNGSINSMVDCNWRTPAFNQIQRTYWGPNISYDKDTLFFYNRSLKETVENITLKLQFMTLSRQKFSCTKQFKVISSKAFYQKTFNMDPWNRAFHATKDIWLTENPFISFTVIKFEENTISKS